MIRIILAITPLIALPVMAETRAYDVASFDKISVSSGIDVHVTAGSDQSISVKQDGGNFGDIKFDVDNGVLKIQRVKTINWGRRRTHYEVTITVQALTELIASSGSEIDASNIDVEFFEMRASSGAEIDASGRCGNLEVKASSGGDINARGLQCENLEGSVSSGGDIDAYASSSVEASASSGGSMRVFGGATNVDINKSSGGSVQVRS